MHPPLLVTFLVLCLYVAYSHAWRVLPAHQASYAEREQDVGLIAPPTYDENAPHTSLHTVYKFGWCKSDVTNRANLLRTSNYMLPHRSVTNTQWIYIIDNQNYRRFSLQCVVVKIYVPSKYALRRTRNPFHYCQGSVVFLMMNTVSKLLLHEFYFMSAFNMPATLVFEYYHPIHE